MFLFVPMREMQIFPFSSKVFYIFGILLLLNMDVSIKLNPNSTRGLNGYFSMVDAYNNFYSFHDNFCCYMTIWFINTPKKFPFIGWFTVKCHLSTFYYYPYGFNGNICHFCKTFPESHVHLFFKCAITCNLCKSIISWVESLPKYFPESRSQLSFHTILDSLGRKFT